GMQRSSPAARAVRRVAPSCALAIAAALALAHCVHPATRIRPPVFARRPPAPRVAAATADHSLDARLPATAREPDAPDHAGVAVAPLDASPVAPEPPPALEPTAHDERAPQFVLVGLDATPGPDTETTFSRRVGDAAERVNARVTYFINTQNFLLNPARRG